MPRCSVCRLLGFPLRLLDISCEAGRQAEAGRVAGARCVHVAGGCCVVRRLLRTPGSCIHVAMWPTQAQAVLLCVPLVVHCTLVVHCACDAIASHAPQPTCVCLLMMCLSSAFSPTTCVDTSLPHSLFVVVIATLSVGLVSCVCASHCVSSGFLLLAACSSQQQRQLAHSQPT